MAKKKKEDVTNEANEILETSPLKLNSKYITNSMTSPDIEEVYLVKDKLEYGTIVGEISVHVCGHLDERIDFYGEYIEKGEFYVKVKLFNKNSISVESMSSVILGEESTDKYLSEFYYKLVDCHSFIDILNKKDCIEKFINEAVASMYRP